MVMMMLLMVMINDDDVDGDDDFVDVDDDGVHGDDGDQSVGEACIATERRSFAFICWSEQAKSNPDYADFVPQFDEDDGDVKEEEDGTMVLMMNMIMVILIPRTVEIEILTMTQNNML